MSAEAYRRFPSVETAFAAIAEGGSVIDSRHVSGGSISEASYVEMSGGQRFLLKRGGASGTEAFVAEADGIAALAAGPGPRLPIVHAVGSDEVFILMEWVAPGECPDRGRRFGRELAELHARRESDRYGFASDNFIGSTRQVNRWSDSWLEFFGEHRLMFQTRMARDRGLLSAQDVHDVEAIVGRLDSLVPIPDHPSLVHGDLWSGNYIYDRDGGAVLIDPAVYYGDREVDVAMTELFGGFPSDFLVGYNEVWRLEAGFRKRVDLYNLYHLLNHANLFGGSYTDSVRATIRKYR